MIENIIRLLLWPLLKAGAFFWAVSGWIKNKEQAKELERERDAAIREAQRQANGAVTTRTDIINRLRKRARDKRKTED